MNAAAASFDPESLREELNSLTKEELAVLEWKLAWRNKARSKQLPPDDPVWGEKANPGWISWFLMSGRGFGKTLTAANWVGPNACDFPGTFTHVVAPTRDDVRYTCFEGETGIITLMPDCLISDYNKSDLIIYLWNGSIIRGFGSERPDKLRGPQCHFFWGEEVAAWSNAKMVWSMVKFGHRLGKKTRTVLTSTPKPVPLIKELVKAVDQKKHYLVRGSTDENKRNLAETFYEEIAKYRGTKLGRQEIEGELIDPEEDGIVQRSQWRLWPADKPLPVFLHVLMSLDTAFTEKTYDPKDQTADPSGAHVYGLFEYEKVFHVMLLDAWVDYLGFPELCQRVKDEMKKTYGKIDKPMFGSSLIPSRYSQAPIYTGTPISQLLVEDKGSGISLRQTLAMENIFMEPYNPGKADKLARLHAVTPMYAHNRVWTVESAKNPGQMRAWADRAVGVICSYHGKGTVEHDEDVDCNSQALNFYMRRFIFNFVKKSDEQVVEEKEKAANEEFERMHSEHPYG